MHPYIAAAAAIAFAGAAHAQATVLPGSSAAIPATAPTQSVSTLPSAQPGAETSRSGSGSIVWTGAVLSVNAGGDSLQNLLRQVARATGMKVTGGVPDEQVFGIYGPGTVQQVLAALFNGLGVNMMLINGSPTQPRELLLTSRVGGPPSPMQPLTASDDPADVNMAQPRPGRHTSPDSFVQPLTQQQPAAISAGPTGSTGSQGLMNDEPASAASTVDANGQPESPNGVRTPEQIFQELRKRQQGNNAPR